MCEKFDAVFWAGDLNFRLRKSRDEVLNIIRKTRGGDKAVAKTLKENDQLTNLLREGKENFEKSTSAIKFGVMFFICQDKGLGIRQIEINIR